MPVATNLQDLRPRCSTCVRVKFQPTKPFLKLLQKPFVDLLIFDESRLMYWCRVNPHCEVLFFARDCVT